MSSRPQSHSPDYRHLKPPSLYILCRQTGLGWSLPGPGLVPHWDKPRFLRWLPSPVNRGSMLAPWLTELTSQQQLTTTIEKSIIGSSSNYSVDALPPTFLELPSISGLVFLIQSQLSLQILPQFHVCILNFIWTVQITEQYHYKNTAAYYSWGFSWGKPVLRQPLCFLCWNNEAWLIARKSTWLCGL